MKIGEYHLQNKLYEDAETSVYEAIRPITQEKVIVKLHSDNFPNSKKTDRIKEEFQLAQQLSGEGIAKYLELVRVGNGYAIVQEYFEGRSLDYYTHGRKIVSIEDFLKVAIQITKALGELHKQKVVHRDISADNILVSSDFSKVQLIDFGLSASFQKLSSEKLGGGKIHYISPEQTGRLNRLSDYRTDFYSLGVLFYKMLTGEFPFESEDSYQIIHKHIASEPKSPKSIISEIPEVIDQIILKLLSKTPDDRYQSTTGLIKDLNTCLEAFSNKGEIPSFPIGQSDFSPIFRMPRQLFGRAKEQKILATHWENCVRNKETQFLLVSGSPGIGKSALVQEIKKSVIEENGFYIYGKFELLNQPIPYRGLIQAFEGLLSQLMTEHKVGISYWKNLLTNALGQNGKVLIEVFPSLEKIIGEQAPLEALSPLESQNRFEYVFSEFIKVFTSQPYPIVIFLDDLQWIDLASLNLLSQLLQNNQNQTLLIIGAYRDNEVDGNHPFKIMEKDLLGKGISIDEIRLENLPLAEVENMLNYCLMRSSKEHKEIAKLIHQKTSGNPFYLHRFIGSLYERGFIYPNLEKGIWELTKEQVSLESATENVVEFLTNQMKKLPEQTRQLMGTGAALGNEFSSAQLAAFFKIKDSELKDILSQAMHEAFLVLDEGKYRFVHDRIHQAAYQYIDDKPKLHLEIGEFLENYREEADEDWIFKITNQLNRSVGIITDPAQRLRLCQYNFEAGIRARDAVAFNEAQKLFAQASNLLPEDHPWESHYKLMWNLTLAQLEVEFITGNQQKATDLADEALKNAQSNFDCATIYNQLVIFSTMKIHYSEALEYGKKGLALLDLQVPNEEDLGPAIGHGFGTIAALMGERLPKELLTNRTLAGEELASIKIKLLVNMLSPAFLSGQSNLWTYLVVTSTGNSIENGNIAESCTAYSSYGILCGLAFDGFQVGYEYGDLAYQLAKSLKSQKQRSNTCFVLGGFLGIYARPSKVCFPILQEGLMAGLQSGELQFAGYNISVMGQVTAASGSSLKVLEERIFQGLQVVEKTKNLFVKSNIMVFYQLIKDLGAPYQLKEIDSGEDFYQTLEKEQNFAARFCFFLYKGFVAYLLGKPQKAFDQFKKAESFIAAIPGTTILSEFYTYFPLVALELVDSKKPNESFDLAISQSLEKLEKWNASVPENFQFRIDLTRAIQKEKEGHILDALDLYDSVITKTSEVEMLPLKALAFEKAARMLLKNNKLRVGEIYLKDAKMAYEEYGAIAKVNQLQKEFPVLIKKSEPRKGSSQGESYLTFHSLETFDSHTLIKASSAISQEVTLKGVLQKMMEVVLENAGAEVGIFIMESEGEWKIEAQGSINPKVFSVLQGIPFPPPKKSGIHVPEKIINYVQNTQKPILLEDAQQSSEFGFIDYLKENDIKSLLCLPVVHLGKLMAIIYLENSLSIGAFNESHKDLIQTLSTQIAISISNAELYENLERKVEERTAEIQKQKEELESTLANLKRTQKQLINSEKMASLGELTAGIAHEIQNPLNFVNNFSEISNELLSEIGLELGKIPNLKEQDLILQILDDLKVNLSKINLHGKRADAIVKSMLEHSQNVSGKKEATDLNRLVSDFTQLAYRNQQAKESDFYVKINLDLDPNLPSIEIIQTDIGKVILNLLKNAFYAMKEKGIEQGKIYLPELHIETKKKGTGIELSIKDNGKGIPENIKDKIFQPFFTTKPTGQGTGLGLSLSHDILVAHGGRIAVESSENQGAKFSIIF